MSSTPLTPRIVAAAIVDMDGNIHTLPAPARHHHILKVMYAKGLDTNRLRNQGFVLEDGTFVDRKKAGDIAVKLGQATSLMWPPELYSEDLW